MEHREKLGFNRNGPVRAYSPDGETLRLKRNKGFGARKEGHDALIDALRNKNTWITIVATSGDVFTGRLNQSDRFTISFTVEGSLVPTIMFKHAIESFQLDVRGE